jgi:hypothetical protein
VIQTEIVLKVPGCDGGDEDSSRNDYCIPERQGPTLYLEQLGKGMFGSPDDNLGSSMSLSHDGKVLAVGAVDGGSTGYVNIYQLINERSWKFTTTITGDEIGAEFGHSVSLSGDGTFLAVGIPKSNNETCRDVGRVRVFELQLDNIKKKFSLVGNDILPNYQWYKACDYPRDGLVFNEDGWQFGYSVSLSGDGKTVAIAEPLDETVVMYQNWNDQWTPMSGAHAGWSISLSNNGLRVAVALTGQGYILDHYDGYEWNQIGQALGDENGQDNISVFFVQKIALSGDGTIVAVSSIDRAAGIGSVQLYQNPNDSDWTSFGEPILGDAGSEDPTAPTIALSNNGQVIAIADYLYDGFGHVRLYHYDSVENEWKQIDTAIRGQNENEQFGKSLAVASDGTENTTVAIGSPHSTHSLGNRGNAIVYQTKLGTKPPSTISPTASPTTPAAAVFEEMFSWKGSYGRVAGNAVSLSVDGRFFAYSVSQPGAEGYVESLVLDETYNKWERLERLTGDEDNARFGFSISLSSSGNVMAVGIPKSDEGDAKDIGRVRVFEFNETARAWNQLAPDIVGLPGDQNGWGDADHFGHCVSLSADGAILAVGAPYGYDHASIFRLEDGQWILMGNSIHYGQAPYGLAGWSVALSRDGLVVAIGAPTNERVSSQGDSSNDSGAARMYKFVNGEWQQRGQDLYGDGDGHDVFGTSISLSGDGNTVAIGSINNDNENGGDAGYVRIYQYDTADAEWIRLGKPILGEAEGDHSGISVSLSDNGRKIAIGANRHGDGGQVRLFQFDSDNTYWRQIGGAIENDSVGSGFGTSVSLVDVAGQMKLAVGAPDTIEETVVGQVRTLTGEVFIFEEIGEK